MANPEEPREPYAQPPLSSPPAGADMQAPVALSQTLRQALAGHQDAVGRQHKLRFGRLHFVRRHTGRSQRQHVIHAVVDHLPAEVLPRPLGERPPERLVDEGHGRCDPLGLAVGRYASAFAHGERAGHDGAL